MAMKYRLFVLFLFALFLSGCEHNPIEVDCNITPEHEICQEEIVCNTGQTLDVESNICMDDVPICEDNQILNTETNICEVVVPVCEDDQVLNTESNICEIVVPICEDNQILDTENNTCIDVPPLCDEHSIFINNECLEIQGDAQMNTNNPVLLNTGNNEGWIFFMNDKPGPIMMVENGNILFVQADANENWGDYTQTARRFVYTPIEFKTDTDYTVQFHAKGTTGEEFTVQFKSGSGTLHEMTYSLDGTDQTFVLDITNPEPTLTGEFSIALGTFSDGNSVIFSDFVITEIPQLHPTINILFIGNSFTYYNDMPTMLESMALANGFDVHVEQITYGGASLRSYTIVGSDRANEVINALNERSWDFVILQDHSSKPLDNLPEMMTSIQKLNTLITENGAETILYSTWSYRDGTDKLATTGLTYNEFYQVLTDGYLQASIQYDTLIAPVGTAFYNLYYDHPEINMYQDDDFHPSVAGSFVAAYIFHTVIFGEENNDIYKPAGISDSLAVILRQYASGAFVNTSE